MWLWALLGWLLVSVVVVTLHHRFRCVQPDFRPEVAAFVLRLETVLAERHPSVRFVGLLGDRFACVLEVEGQEVPVALGDAFRHERANPDGFEGYVAQLLDEIREVALDRVEDDDFAFSAPHILPQVRGRRWLEERGCFGDSGLVYRPINDELVTVYVVDDPHCMVFVCRAHLKRWRKEEPDLYNLAMANLAGLDPARREELRHVEEPIRVDSGDGYDAARLLLLDQQDGLLVAVPDRDVLWVGSESEVDLPSLMADTREIAEHAPHPISPHVFRVSAGRIDAVVDPD